MRKIKSLALSTMLSLGLFSGLMLTSCSEDDCKDVVCQNNGVCNGGNCDCPDGYEGTLCENLSSAKFVASWTAAETRTFTQDGNRTETVTPHTAAVVPVVSNLVTVNIGNLNDFFVDPVVGTISGNTITIAEQEPDGDDFMVSGTITLSTDGSTMTVDYNVWDKTDVTAAASTYTVSGTWTK